MNSGGEVRFRRKLALSVLAAAFLAGWVVVPMNANAELQQDLRIANDGTVYQYFCSNGSTNHIWVTNVGGAIAFSPSPANLGGTL